MDAMYMDFKGRHQTRNFGGYVPFETSVLSGRCIVNCVDKAEMVQVVIKLWGLLFTDWDNSLIQFQKYHCKH